MNFTKLLRTPFLTEHLQWLLLEGIPYKQAEYKKDGEYFANG